MTLTLNSRCLFFLNLKSGKKADGELIETLIRYLEMQIDSFFDFTHSTWQSKSTLKSKLHQPILNIRTNSIQKDLILKISVLMDKSEKKGDFVTLKMLKNV